MWLPGPVLSVGRVWVVPCIVLVQAPQQKNVQPWLFRKTSWHISESPPHLAGGETFQSHGAGLWGGGWLILPLCQLHQMSALCSCVDGKSGCVCL